MYNKLSMYPPLNYNETKLNLFPWPSIHSRFCTGGLFYL